MRVAIFAVMLETVHFYMSEKSPLIDYQPDGSKFRKQLYFRGYNLASFFICER